MAQDDEDSGDGDGDDARAAGDSVRGLEPCMDIVHRVAQGYKARYAFCISVCTCVSVSHWFSPA